MSYLTTNQQAYITAALKAQELKVYRQYIYTQIDTISALIDVREKRFQWHTIKYMKAQKDLLIDQTEEIYNELSALETQIISYLKSCNS